MKKFGLYRGSNSLPTCFLKIFSVLFDDVIRCTRVQRMTSSNSTEKILKKYVGSGFEPR